MSRAKAPLGEIPEPLDDLSVATQLRAVVKVVQQLSDRIEGNVQMGKETATELRVTTVTTAADLQQATANIATDVKETAERNAADLAQVVVSTAVDVKETAEKAAAVVKEAADRNAVMTPLLLQSFDVVTRAVNGLSVTADNLAKKSVKEEKMLRERTKYFIMIGVLLVTLIILNIIELAVK
jgi:uncharacterized protein (DUF885 family)